MVQVRQTHLLQNPGDINIPGWVELLCDRDGLKGQEHQMLLVEACEMAEEAQADSRSQCFFYGLEMAEILADLHLDRDALVAAVLYRSVREERLSLAKVHKHFGKAVTDLIDSVLQMAVISTLRNDSQADVFGHAAGQQAAKVREMLVSIIDDVRVALIKIAERTCAIRAVKDADEAKRIRVAREIFDVYAPLAHRLGIGHLKWELEDLAFRYLEPLEYKQIAKLLDERRLDRQHYIEEAVEILERELKKADIAGEVSGRAKHIYSIWRKMQRKDIGFSQVYDIRAVRILVPTIDECYSMLGIVHSLWRNIPNEFDDYIAAPKENGYRSLHTAVIGPQRRVLEIQIRTYKMHEEAELGVCAHWRYKSGEQRVSVEDYEDKIAWLRQVLEWHEELEGEGTRKLMRNHMAENRIYVFTPEGHVVDLPNGATPLDFAYRVHTEVGHRCRGAKVNNKIVPLNTPLKTSDQVQILTGKQNTPSRDWLVVSMGYTKTVRARAKIRQWFRQQDREDNIEAAKTLLDKELRQLGIRDAKLENIAQKLNKKDIEGLYAAIGAGDLSLRQVIRAIIVDQQKQSGQPIVPVRTRKASKLGETDVYIQGVDNLLSRKANCCNPVPGDEIEGYITAGRGVTIHRKDCGNFLRLCEAEPERIIQVNWGRAPEGRLYGVNIRVEAYDRPGLLRDITTALDIQNVAIKGINSSAGKKDKADTFLLDISVEVRSIDSLSVALKKLQQIPNVFTAKRLEHA